MKKIAEFQPPVCSKVIIRLKNVDIALLCLLHHYPRNQPQSFTYTKCINSVAIESNKCRVDLYLYA